MSYNNTTYINYSNLFQNFKWNLFTFTFDWFKSSRVFYWFSLEIALWIANIISLLQQCNSLLALMFHAHLNADPYFLNVS